MTKECRRISYACKFCEKEKLRKKRDRKRGVDALPIRKDTMPCQCVSQTDLHRYGANTPLSIGINQMRY